MKANNLYLTNKLPWYNKKTLENTDMERDFILYLYLM